MAFISKIQLPSGGVYDLKVQAANVAAGTFVSGMSANSPTEAAHIATKGYVDTTVSLLPKPMQFKGTAGTDGNYVPDSAATGTKLPAAAEANNGWTVKVITDGTYATVTAKEGDTLISNGIVWILIPSGDEPTGTVTNIATSDGVTSSPNPITTSGTIKANLKSYTKDSANAGNDGDGSLIPVKLDKSGKLAVKVPAGVSVPNSFGKVKVGSTTITSDSTEDTLELAAGSNITLTPDATNDKVTIAASFTDKYTSAATFADDTTNHATTPVKMTLTVTNGTNVNGYIPAVSSSTAGVAPKGAAVSTQSQSTKFLREDGTWAAPTYTVNTDNYVDSATITSTDSDTTITITLGRTGDLADVSAVIPAVSSTTAGIVKKGASVSTQNQSTKFLREDGTWAAPTYTVNTDRYVNSANFTYDSTNDNVKMTLTRAGSDTATVVKNIPKVSSSTAGVVPKGAAVSSQSQSTKFLREDGTWAAPTYTTSLGINSITGVTTTSINNPTKKKVVLTVGTGSSVPTGATEVTPYCHMAPQPPSGQEVPGWEETLVFDKIYYTTGDSISTSSVTNILKKS